jgi:hypothetical protein
MASWLFAKFGSQTDRALVKDRVVMFEFGNAINMVVSVVQVFIAGVAETLMPEESFGTGGEAVGEKSRVQRREECIVVPKSMDRAIRGERARGERMTGRSATGKQERFRVAEPAV